jgi:hypothetical protein
MAPTASYEQLLARLVDIPDPPVPGRASPLTKMSPEEARRNTIGILLVGAGLIGVGGLLWHFGHTIWAGIVGGLGLLFLVMIFSPKTLIAACPYCGHRITGLLESPEPKEQQCEKCFEYSLVKNQTVSPLGPSTVSEVPRFETPVFDSSRWPKGCVACGAPPTRLDDLSQRSVNATMLVVGRVSVMKGSVEGVPYCAAHKDNLELVVKQDRSLRLRWCSLRMMRRYLAANRGVVRS